MLSACTGHEADRAPETINRPFTVLGARVEAESLNTFLAAHRGFTSRGGEMRCAYRPLGQSGTKVFVWAVCGELLAVDGRVADGSGMSVPAAFEIEVAEGRPRIVGVEIPEDGDRYDSSIRRIFPSSTWPAILANGGPDQPAAGLGDYLRRDAAARFGLPPSAAIGPRVHAPLPAGAKENVGKGDRARVRPSPGSSASTLDSAARRIIEFLQGKRSADQVALSDTVTLYVSPEGGAGSATFTGDQLRRRSAWVVRSGQRDFALAAPRQMSELTTKVGRHLHCREERLDMKFPTLAQLPHVGTMLKPDNGASCLQTWNLTMVFDTSAAGPRLIAAVYDQWEW